MSEDYKNMDYYQLYEYIEKLREQVHEQDLLYMKAYQNYHEWKEELERLRVENSALRKQLEESNAKIEYILARIYAMDCDSFDRVSARVAVAHLCDEELDRSGALLGR